MRRIHVAGLAADGVRALLATRFRSETWVAPAVPFVPLKAEAPGGRAADPPGVGLGPPVTGPAGIRSGEESVMRTYRQRLLTAAAMVPAAAMIAVTGAAAAGAGTGEPPASLNAVTVTSKGAMAVGADSISTFLNPLCGTDMSVSRGASRWAAVKTPSPGCGWLSSVAGLPGNKAWAVGYQTNSSGVTHTLTEYYNGSSWAIEPSPNPGPMDQLSSVTITPSGTVWAAGVYYKSNGDQESLLLERTGSTWTPVTAPGLAFLEGITSTPGGQLWAVGYGFNGNFLNDSTVILTQTASGWKQVPSPSPGKGNGSYLYSVAAGPDNALWAVGKYYDSKTGAPHTLTVRYQSGKWAQVPSPTPGPADDWFYSAVITPGGQVWAVGGATSSKCESNLAEEYAGGAWKVVTVPDRGACTSSNANALYGVTATSTGTLYAVGESDISTLVEQNTSGSWKIVPSDN
jgi:hypothetical protein